MRRVRLRSLLVYAVLFFATAVFAQDPYYTVTKTASNTVLTKYDGTVKLFSDDQGAIQWAINYLPSNRTTKARVKLTGDFYVDDTINLKSYLIFDLDGKITLSNNVNKQLVATATVTTGETDIEMIGGIYDANKNNQNKSAGGFYCIYLKHARNSIFRDFVVQNCGQDGFILDTRCSNNVCMNLLGRNTGLPETGISNGNGMGDRGDNNTWTDCLTDDTYSDGFVFKCRNSVWRRCVAKNGVTGAGFGLFCDALIASNKVYDCEVYNFKGRAFSLRKPGELDKGDDPIRNNYFEVYIHDSGSANNSDDQVGFRLWSSRNKIGGKELIRDNQVHLMARNNYDQGFYIKDSHVSGTTGTIVCYSNHPDARIEGHNNKLTFLVPDLSKDSISKGGVSNTVTIRTISRSDTNSAWAARKYYSVLDGKSPSTIRVDIPHTNVTRTVGDTLYVKVTAFDSDGIEWVKIYTNGTEYSAIEANAPYEFNLPLRSVGTVTLTAKVKDKRGNITTSSNSRTITVLPVVTATTTVPNVINQTLSAATTSITSAGLVVGTVTSNYSSTVAAGKVISQTPGGGTTVNRGTSVALAVSLGPQPSTTTVPNVINQTLSAATTSITSAGLVVGTVTSNYSSTVAAGKVISQTPGGGTTVNRGTAVALAVSRGPATTTASCHIDIPTGNVTKNTGDTLYVKVSAFDPDGIERVKIYTNNTEVASDSSNPYEFNMALPSAGTFTLIAKVKDVNGNYTTSDNSRTITVLGTTTTVPGVTSLTLSAATTSITAARLVVGSVSSNYSSTVAAGKVISQTPGGGSIVPIGTSVNLAVSLGPQTGGSTVTFTSVAAHDGYVDETSETSNMGGTMSATLTSGTALRVGDTGARKQRRSFVSFNTASLPDNAVVTKAVLKLKRGAIVGAPTSLGALTVDIKSTSFGFGTTEALESGDFQASASKSNVGTLSYPTANGAWATATLNADGISRINKTDHTQFRIRFTTDDDNDSADDYLGFYPGDNATAANRPVLEVTYQ